jgi:hypothetical protein
LLLPDKFKPLVITKYDAKQDPIQWLRCYALSIENAGGNNDTKCLYFPFCLDQATLTWLESLDKHSIDKWDQCWGIQENTSPSKRRSLTAFPKYVFQAQEIREYRKSGTCEVSSSRMCRVRETWFGEETEP